MLMRTDPFRELDRLTQRVFGTETRPAAIPMDAFRDGGAFAERPTGAFSRQLFLGETLDTDRIAASYEAGVLRVTIPVAERAKPRKIEIRAGNGSLKEINA